MNIYPLAIDCEVREEALRRGPLLQFLMGSKTLELMIEPAVARKLHQQLGAYLERLDAPPGTAH